MIDLTIYDSQGQPLDDPSAPKNERIANFFFDGVRLAIENIDSVRAYCFFRARESEGARLDQFYAEFEASSVGDIGNLKSAVERKVTGEHDMILESSTEDSAVFDLIDDASSLTPPGDRNTRDLIPQLISRGERPRFGVSNYRDALALLFNVIQNSRANKAAIADNAESAELSDYDIVIETGDHTGLVPIGDTEDALARERRNSLRSERGGALGDAPGGSDSRYQSPLGGGPADDDLSRRDKLLSIGIISAFGIAVIALLVGGAFLGACVLNVNLPLASELCVLDSTDNGGNGDEPVGTNMSWYDVSTDAQTGTISVQLNESMDFNTVELRNTTRNETIRNETIENTTTTSWQDLSPGEYRVIVTNSSGSTEERSVTLSAPGNQSSGEETTMGTMDPDPISDDSTTSNTTTTSNDGSESRAVSVPTVE